jgi:hypothetical protein
MASLAALVAGGAAAQIDDAPEDGRDYMKVDTGADTIGFYGTTPVDAERAIHRAMDRTTAEMLTGIIDDMKKGGGLIA